MDVDKKPLYAHGYWIWHEVNNCLLFVSTDSDEIQSVKSTTAVSATTNITTSTNVQVSDTFVKEKGLTKERARQIWLSKCLKRKINPQTDVVILQDVKDVALFLMNPTILYNDFIDFFHTKAVDDVLRCLIVYFQYMIQVWEKVLLRRKETRKKIRRPVVNTAWENIIRDNLADLRAMFGRSYSVLITGTGDVKKFYHLNIKNNTSFSEKDKRLHGTFFTVTRHVIWIALNRKHLALIDVGMNHLMRSSTFGIIQHSLAEYRSLVLPDEERIFQSPTYIKETKLLQHSQAIQEILSDSHDYRMLAIGVSDVQGSDERQRYLNIAYSAPEELLQELGVPVGILGVPMKYVDTMLKPIEKFATERRVSIMPPLPTFDIPPYVPEDASFVEIMPNVPCKYKIPLERLRHIINQRRLWHQYVFLEGNVVALIPLKDVIAPSYGTLHTAKSVKIKTAWS